MANTYNEVCDILIKHGDEILQRYAEYGQEDFKEKGFCYDCYHGRDFFRELFTKNYRGKQNMFEDYPLRSIPLKRDMIHHCRIETDAGEDYEKQQVHFFMVLFSETPIVFSSYMEQGILLKRVRGDIDEILGAMIDENESSNYINLFEIPDEFVDLVDGYYKCSFSYLSEPIYNPSLEDLNKILSRIGLDYAEKKLNNLI